MVILYFLTVKCIFHDLLHGSHICSFISFHFKAMVKSMFINNTYVLNGLGIFMGRFLRFHTVHLITRPFIITEVIRALNGSSLIFISLMMLLQFVILLFIKRDKNGTLIYFYLIQFIHVEKFYKTFSYVFKS